MVKSRKTKNRAQGGVLSFSGVSNGGTKKDTKNILWILGQDGCQEVMEKYAATIQKQRDAQEEERRGRYEVQLGRGGQWVCFHNFWDV